MDETRRIRGEHRPRQRRLAATARRMWAVKVNLPCVEPVERQGGGERRSLRGASMVPQNDDRGRRRTAGWWHRGARRSRSSRSGRHPPRRSRSPRRALARRVLRPAPWSPAVVSQPRPDGLVRGVEVVLGHEHRPLHDIGQGCARCLKRGARVVDRAGRLLGYIVRHDLAVGVHPVLTADVDGRRAGGHNGDVAERGADDESSVANVQSPWAQRLSPDRSDPVARSRPGPVPAWRVLRPASGRHGAPSTRLGHGAVSFSCPCRLAAPSGRRAGPGPT